MNSGTLNLENLIEGFRLSCQTEGKSPKTIEWYFPILRRFFGFLKVNGSNTNPKEIGRFEVRTYIKHLQEAKRWANKPGNGEDQGKLSPSAVQGHVRAIKAFWGWLFNNEYIETNALAKFPLPKVPKTILKTLTPEQIKSFLNAIDRFTSTGARNYSITLLMIDTGMRISEVVSIRFAELDLNMCRVKITGKGQKEREVSIHKITRKELLRYIDSHRQQLCKLESSYLFPARDGDHISITSMQQAIKRIGRRAGSSGLKYHAHLFRHTFATMFLAKGGDVMVLKDILGHESILTTQKYVHLLPEDLQRQHWKYSPMEDLFGDKN